MLFAGETVKYVCGLYSNTKNVQYRFVSCFEPRFRCQSLNHVCLFSVWEQLDSLGRPAYVDLLDPVVIHLGGTLVLLLYFIDMDITRVVI